MRRDYGQLELSEERVCPNPLNQFKAWFDEASSSEQTDPTAMVLSTVDETGHPDARVVLLKALEPNGFVFYTNYDSPKGKQLETCPLVALTFYWPIHARQIRIRGQIEKTSAAQSDAYFATRPRLSQIAAVASHQSELIGTRFLLEAVFNETLLDYEHDATITRPTYWGGYLVIPHQIEFWQGRDNRLHDRLVYTKHQEGWQIARLCP